MSCRPLVADAARGIGAPARDRNLVIHGDKLQALKSLLLRHAGAVDLIFIDPPYNTGNQGWCYSDGVNSPLLKESDMIICWSVPRTSNKLLSTNCSRMKITFQTTATCRKRSANPTLAPPMTAC